MKGKRDYDENHENRNCMSGLGERLQRKQEDNPNFGYRFHLNKKEVYARILIKRVIK